MGEIAESLAIIQILSSIMILVPVIYWVVIKRVVVEDPPPIDQNLSMGNICVILPMRNEISNVERKLAEVIDEILSDGSVTLVVADSSSEDGTAKTAEKFLKSSELEDERWMISDFEGRGKNVALNGVLSEVDSDIFVISDADAQLSPGWLKIIRSRLGEDDVGVVSGMEKEIDSGSMDFNRYYRSKSNLLRIIESSIDSTPVLEGSILGWKTSALGPFVIDEGMNADNAQIGFFSIRSGHRSVVDDRLVFRSFDSSNIRTFKESVRRAQGLSLAIMKNADLIVSGGRKKYRIALFNAFFLYLIFPWALLVFAANSLIAFSLLPEVGVTWQFFSVIASIFLLIHPQGRFLARGTAISIVGHSMALVGKRYKNWEPNR